MQRLDESEVHHNSGRWKDVDEHVNDDEHADERVYLRGLGKRIRLLRVDRELSQEQLARAAGMSRNFVSSIERGAHGVDVVRLLRLASALDVDIAVLVSDRSSRRP